MGLARKFHNYLSDEHCDLCFIYIQGVNPTTKILEITTTANQDPLLTHAPVIGVDIWEHAFYLQYKNVKADVSGCLSTYYQMF
jgi:hypothetical protein